MSKFAVAMVDAYTNEIIEVFEDELFDTEEEAEESVAEWIEGFSAGAEVLELAGRGYTSPDDVEFTVVEIQG